MRHLRVFRPWVCLVLGGASAAAQAVISTHAGTINFSEGEVFLDDQPLNQKAATFPSVKNGCTLRTEKGRAEVLLQPSVFLRVDENSAIRMVSDDLSKTRIAFVKGAVILDSNDQTAGTPLVLEYNTYQFRFLKPGVYRLNAEPGILETYSGEAEVTPEGQPPKKVDESHEFFLDIGMLTPKYGDGTMDAFSEWARKRSDNIEAANKAQQGITDPADSNADPGYDAGPGLPGISPGYGGASPGYGGMDPGYGGASPGYGSMAGPVTVTPSIYSGYGPFGLYGSAWGTPFLIPTAIFVLPYYHRYPTSNHWNHRPAYPTALSSQTGLGLVHSPGLGSSATMLGLTGSRVGVGIPRYTVPHSTAPAPHYSAPHYSAPAGVHAGVPHVMVHR
jgi:hypothetical protein